MGLLDMVPRTGDGSELVTAVGPRSAMPTLSGVAYDFTEPASQIIVTQVGCTIRSAALWPRLAFQHCVPCGLQDLGSTESESRRPVVRA
jgi:hypothetical protein